MLKEFFKTVGWKGLLALISMLAAGVVLANGAGKFFPPELIVIVNAAITMSVATQFKHRPIFWLEITAVIIFVSVGILSSQHAGLLLVAHAMLNVLVAFFKIIPTTEAG